jgi:hypothetical protein
MRDFTVVWCTCNRNLVHANKHMHADVYPPTHTTTHTHPNKHTWSISLTSTSPASSASLTTFSFPSFAAPHRRALEPSRPFVSVDICAPVRFGRIQTSVDPLQNEDVPRTAAAREVVLIKCHALICRSSSTKLGSFFVCISKSLLL